MFIVMNRDARPADVEAAAKHLEANGYSVHVADQSAPPMIVVRKVDAHVEAQVEALVATLPGVARVMPSSGGPVLASRVLRESPTVVDVRVGGVSSTVGAPSIAIFAGPCSVESEEQLLEVAHAVREAGATFLRGGAYKPRTSPYAFQGHGEAGLKLLALAREATGLPVITEVLTPEDVPVVGEYADVFQVGARNMQNYSLLKALAKRRKPVFLKRGFASTLDELLQSAEYLLAGGNNDVILCERGVRTFEGATRFTFDVNAFPVMKQRSHLPMVGDPSHATGRASYVPAIAKAAIAAGADGIMVEVHPRPRTAMSDGDQSLDLDQFVRLMRELRPVAAAVGRALA